MKKFLLVFVIGILIFSGFGVSALTDVNTKSISLKIDFTQPIINNEKEYVSIEFEKANSYLMEYGKPILPSYIHTFKFPFGTKIKSISCKPSGIYHQKISKDVLPTPNPISGFNTKKEKTVESILDYGENPYPSLWYTHDIGAGINNNERCVIVKFQFFPVKYHPADDIIECVSNVDITLEYEESLGFKSFDDQYDLIVIGPSEFSDELAELITHKNNRGISTIFISLDDVYNGAYFPSFGRDDQEKIKYFIKDAIENWDTNFVLLVGGIDKLPARETHIYFSEGEDDEIFISDLYYADIYNDSNVFCSWDSNENDIFGEYNWSTSQNYDDVDLYPDVYLGRLACVDNDELITCINKIKKYEEEGNEAYKQNWFNDLVVIGGDHAPGDDNAVDEGEYVNQKVMDIMVGFIPDKVWDSNKRLSRLFPTGVMEINKAINAGCGFIDFSGHGNTNLWGTHAHEKENKWIPTPSGYYFNGKVKGLNNGDELPIVIIGACSTCKYNVDPDCFGWSFLLNSEGGGIASCGASALDWFYWGEYVTEKGFEKICIDSFQSYADGAMTFGEIWSGAINRYIYPEMDGLDYKTVEEFQSFGDPTLAIREKSQAPNAPIKPSGPTNGNIGTTYNYSTSTTDPDEDNLYYLFDWGDGTYSGWQGPYTSGATVSADHKWKKQRNYEIKVIAKDENGVIGEWSESLTVTMPRDKETYNTFFFWLLEQFPFLSLFIQTLEL
jgi:hypothetical protein